MRPLPLVTLNRLCKWARDRVTMPAYARYGRIALIVSLACCLLTGRAEAQQNPPALADADAKYASQSYGSALALYESLLNAGGMPADRQDEVRYRLLICLEKAQRWDGALEEGRRFVRAHRGTEWEARGVYWMARLYSDVIHYGWRAAGRVYRQHDMPPLSGGETPDMLKFSATDFRNGTEALVAAHTLYERLPDADKNKPALIEERIQLDYDLLVGGTGVDRNTEWVGNLIYDSYCPVWEWANDRHWALPSDPVWDLDTHAPYDPKWPLPKRVLYLTRHLRQLTATLPARQAEVMLEEAKFLRGYHLLMAGIARKRVNGNWERVPYPYQNLTADALLNELQLRFPKTAPAAKAQWYRALSRIADGRPAEAVPILKDCLARFPDSPLARSVTTTLDQLQEPSISILADRSKTALQQRQIVVRTRNASRIRVEVYRVDLVALMAQSQAFQPDTLQKANWECGATLLKKLVAHDGLAPLLASRTLQPVQDRVENVGYPGDMRVRLHTIALPFGRSAEKGGYTNKTNEKSERASDKNGIYAVVVSVRGATATYRSALLVPVTDILLVHRRDWVQNLFYVTDAITGRPIPGARLLVRQQEESRLKSRIIVSWGRTDASGTFVLPSKPAPGNYIRNVQALAWVGKNIALAEENQFYNGADGSDTESLEAYGVTDRSVYRPGETLYFRQQVLMHATAGGTAPMSLAGTTTTAGKQGQKPDSVPLLPVPNRHVTVMIRSMKKGEIWRHEFVTDRFGIAAGRVVLPADTPLGSHQVEIVVPRLSRRTGKQLPRDESMLRLTSWFLVEEYKRPEFYVTVSPLTPVVRLGQTAKFKIHAEYYFGGPVPDATVSYVIYRNDSEASYRFPHKYDRFYTGQSPSKYYYSYEYHHADGSTRLDAQGNAIVTLHTTDSRTVARGSKDASPKSRDQNDVTYRLEAWVRDASRRKISGKGSLHAVAHDLKLYLNYPHGYALAGEPLDVAIKAVTSSIGATALRGVARIYRTGSAKDGQVQKRDKREQRDKRQKREEEALIWSASVGTDRNGEGHIRWKRPEGGRYRVVFSATGGDGVPVRAEQEVWVYGEGLRSRPALTKGIRLMARNLYQEEGRSARLLVVTPEPGCSLLLVRERAGRTVDRLVFDVPGYCRELSVPITSHDVPNFHVSAIMIRNRQVEATALELLVPPMHEILNVQVTPNKRRYLPGERAHWELTVRDHRNRPVRASLSLAVSDKSLDYIVGDLTEDIGVTLYAEQNEKAGSTVTSVPGKLVPVTNVLVGDGYWAPSKGAFTGISLTDVYSLQRDETLMLPEDQRPKQGQDRYVVISQRGGAWLFLQDELAGRHDRGGAEADMPYGQGAAAVADKAGDLKSASEVILPQWVGRAGQGLASATIRKDFKDTAFWTPSVVTDATGHAHVEFSWPDNLTEWRAHAIGSSLDAKVGMGEAKVTTKKDLLVQLEAPRFVVERDIVTLSAVVHNDTSKDARVLVRLFLDNADITADDTTVVRLTSLQTQKQPEKQTEKQPEHMRVRVSETWVNIPHGGQKRVDWLVRPRHEGQMHVRMAAQSATDGDAAQILLPVLVHGVESTTAQSGQIIAVRGTPQSTALTVHLPEMRKPGSSQLLVTLNPSLAGVLLEALPYLADYPYGCVEQTMSRFLPSVLVAHSLQTSGYDLSALQQAIERERKNAPLANGQAHPDSGYTYPGGLTPGQKAAFPAGPPPSRFDTANPLLTAGTLDKMVKAGLQRLAEFEHADGGWGWWKEGASDPYMTAYVLDGLLQCQRCSIQVPYYLQIIPSPPGSLAIPTPTDFLLAQYKEENDLHLLVYEAYVLSRIPEVRGSIQTRIEKRLWPDREKLSPYGKALLALTLHEMGQKQQATVVLENLETTIQVDNQHRTAHWEISGNGWQWYNSKVETNATILRAYIKINGPWHPGNIARGSSSPYPSMLSKWLIDNRQGSTWQDTRDTAIAVGALSEWMRASQETAPDYTVTLDLGGRIRRSYRVTPQNALFFDNTFVVPDAMLTTGDQTLTLTLTGTGVCYYTAQTRTFSQEEPIRATGDQIRVRRRYFRLTPRSITEPAKSAVKIEQTVAKKEERVNPFLTGRYELLDELDELDEKDVQARQSRSIYGREEILDGTMVHGGDLIEVELLLEASNDYDYVLVEDMKPAGCESVELTSDGDYWSGLYANREMRDTKVAYFLDKLPQGTRLLTYRLHAEVPGLFHTLPTNVFAMYAPTVRSLSNEARISIKDGGVGNSR